ncbi:hypothetical protein EJB05_42873, partial [Eragrostis curvula]
MVTYYLATDHHAACPSAPCYCLVPDCGFVSSQVQLVDHFRRAHTWLVYPFSYAWPGKLAVSASASRHILMGEGDDDVFLVSVRSLSAVTLVSLLSERSQDMAFQLPFSGKGLPFPSSSHVFVQQGFVSFQEEHMAKQLKKGSTLGKGDHISKRPRVLAVQYGDVSKEMVTEVEVNLVYKAERVVVSMAAVEEPRINLMFRPSTFLCRACDLPLKPPTVKCKVDHVVRGNCRGKHGQVFSYAATYSPYREQDFVILDAKLSCQNAVFGC